MLRTVVLLLPEAGSHNLGLYTVRMVITGKTVGQWLLLAMLATLLYFCFRIMQRFLMPILLALILSTLLAPIYRLVANKLSGRRSLAALIVCVGLTLSILVPVVFPSISLASDDPELSAASVVAIGDPCRRCDPWESYSGFRCG